MDIPDAHTMQGRDETEAHVSCQNVTPEQKMLRGVSDLLGIYRQDVLAENIELKRQIADKERTIQEQAQTIQRLEADVAYLRNLLENVVRMNPSSLKRPQKTFLSLITHSQPKLVLKRLHELIDNKGGLYVAAVLMKSYWKDKILSKLPTQKEYTSEFKLQGSWRSISNYLSKDSQKTLQVISDMYDSIQILPLTTFS